MNRISDLIQPVSGKHSIKEAVITVFLSHPIETPESFENLIDTHFQGIFTHFKRQDTVRIQLELDTPEMASRQINTGFRFEKMDGEDLRLVFQSIKMDDKTQISFHSLEYTRWDAFFSAYIGCLDAIIGQHANFRVEAFNLHYIDEFVWIKDSEPDLRLVLNERSDFIAPSILKKSFPRQDLFFTTDQSGVNGTICYDRVNISVVQTIKPSITVSHTVSHQLNESIDIADLIKQERFKKLLTLAHNQNKEILKNILAPETAQLIALK